MTANALTVWLERDRLMRLADGFAVGVAVSLPWSTSATSILIALWLAALVPTLAAVSLRRALAHPAGGLPVALCALMVVGMLWADVAFTERLSALRGPYKLLVIPLLLVHFQRSDRGVRVIVGFLASCTLLLAVSFLITVWPSLVFWRYGIGYVGTGVPVKEYLVQSGEFVLCVFALAHLAFNAWGEGRRVRAFAFTALALAFLGNVLFIATGRSSLLVLAALIVVFGLQRLGWRGSLGLLAGAAVLAAVSWASSPYLRTRVAAVADEIKVYRAGAGESSSGFRLQSWTKSIEFIAAAPLFGHGTGSPQALFRHAAAGDQNATTVISNPHDMTLEVGIQLGLLGVVVLYALWGAHLMVFRGSGLAAHIGLGVVVWNIVFSVFLSHLFDFTSGWLYVFGVGVLGGMVLRLERGPALAAHSESRPAGWRAAGNVAKE
jgi:O-antigen ligase